MAPAAIAPVKYAGRNYLIEFCAVMALYVGAIAVRPWLIAHTESAGLALAIKLLPIVPIWLLLGVVWRHYRRIDEFEQHKFLVTLAVSFGIGSCVIMSYSFLMDAGLPALAITWAWPTLATTWAINSAIQSIANRG